MEFCELCNNMIYIKNDDENNLVLYCKHCYYSNVITDSKCIKLNETEYYMSFIQYRRC